MDMTNDRNVLGGELEPCGTEPVTGFYRDGCCNTGPDDLVTPQPEYGFPGLQPGDRWCVCAARWQEAYEADAAPPVVLAATHKRALEVIALENLRKYAADVPADPSSLA